MANTNPCFLPLGEGIPDIHRPLAGLTAQGESLTLLTRGDPFRESRGLISDRSTLRSGPLLRRIYAAGCPGDRA